MESNKVNKGNIPSAEDFARADRLMEERNRNLDQVCANVTSRFVGSCPLCKVLVLWQIDVDFRAYIFFKKDKDIDACRESGTLGRIEDCVYEELERAGRGKRGEIIVECVFDSDEQVQRKFGGDYLLRLHAP
jgi:hypothetical protein